MNMLITRPLSGYFSLVTSMDEVKEKVGKYMMVMARPMVLNQTTHPVQWTEAYEDAEVRDASLSLIFFNFISQL